MRPRTRRQELCLTHRFKLLFLVTSTFPRSLQRIPKLTGFLSSEDEGATSARELNTPQGHIPTALYFPERNPQPNLNLNAHLAIDPSMGQLMADNPQFIQFHYPAYGNAPFLKLAQDSSGVETYSQPVSAFVNNAPMQQWLNPGFALVPYSPFEHVQGVQIPGWQPNAAAGFPPWNQQFLFGTPVLPNDVFDRNVWLSSARPWLPEPELHPYKSVLEPDKLRHNENQEVQRVEEIGHRENEAEEADNHTPILEETDESASVNGPEETFEFTLLDQPTRLFGGGSGTVMQPRELDLFPVRKMSPPDTDLRDIRSEPVRVPTRVDKNALREDVSLPSKEYGHLHVKKTTQFKKTNPFNHIMSDNTNPLRFSDGELISDGNSESERQQRDSHSAEEPGSKNDGEEENREKKNPDHLVSDPPISEETAFDKRQRENSLSNTDTQEDISTSENIWGFLVPGKCIKRMKERASSEENRNLKWILGLMQSISRQYPGPSLMEASIPEDLAAFFMDRYMLFRPSLSRQFGHSEERTRQMVTYLVEVSAREFDSMGIEKAFEVIDQSIKEKLQFNEANLKPMIRHCTDYKVVIETTKLKVRSSTKIALFLVKLLCTIFRKDNSDKKLIEIQHRNAWMFFEDFWKRFSVFEEVPTRDRPNKSNYMIQIKKQVRFQLYYAYEYRGLTERGSMHTGWNLASAWLIMNRRNLAKILCSEYGSVHKNWRVFFSHFLLCAPFEIKGILKSS